MTELTEKLDDAAIRKKWSKLLLCWVKQCISPTQDVKVLNSNTILLIMNRYKPDIEDYNCLQCELTPEDLELYVDDLYPKLKLSRYNKNKNPTKIYILTSVLLFHSCLSSKTGKVGGDICHLMSKNDQYTILRFCETLFASEITVENIETAIRVACESKYKSKSNLTASQKEALSKMNLNLNLRDFPSQSMPSLNFSRSGITCVARAQSVTMIPVSEATVPPPPSRCFQFQISERYAQTDPFKPWDRYGRYTLSEPRGVIRPHMDLLDTAAFAPDVETACFTCRCICFWILFLIAIMLVAFIISNIYLSHKYKSKTGNNPPRVMKAGRKHRGGMFLGTRLNKSASWRCTEHLCEKVTENDDYMVTTYPSHSKCTLLCTGPQLWPYPTTTPHFGSEVVALASTILDFKFKTIPSEAISQYLLKATEMFSDDLTTLEKRRYAQDKSTLVRKTTIEIDVSNDTDPRLRLDTDESYTLNIRSSTFQIIIKIESFSFCGARHGLETLSQLILLDKSIGYLITLNEVSISDSPINKYRGLMVDTARNFLPVPDLIRTIDGMAMVKLNTFHWRISDGASFPMEVPDIPELIEYGAYDNAMIYKIDDIRAIVDRAAYRGIRVLIEVAAPGPVGRPWSWSDQVSCPYGNGTSCDNILCLRMEMTELIFDALQLIYAQIIKLTKVEDVFHLSNGVFSLATCYNLFESRQGYLNKALDSLRFANGGKLPKLPLIWYSKNWEEENEGKVFDDLGIQLHEMPMKADLRDYKVIHSSRWDLSCDMQKQRCTKYRTWQEMYGWKSWRNIEVYTIEGGEAILWTDLVDSGNLDYHIWPRTAAIAEILWSDAHTSAEPNVTVYSRLNSQSQLMLLRGIQVQPVWPTWCNYYPVSCRDQIELDKV